MSTKHKKVQRDLNYNEHLFILISTVTGCISVSSFASSDGIPIAVTSSAIRLKICVVTAGIKRCKSLIKKKKKKHDKILLSGKSKLNSIEVLISEALIDLNVSISFFVLINNVPEELHDIKEKIKNSNDK